MWGSESFCSPSIWQRFRNLALVILCLSLAACSQTSEISKQKNKTKQTLAAAPTLSARSRKTTTFRPLPLPLKIVYPQRYDQGIERKGEIFAVSNSAQEVARIFDKTGYNLDSVRRGSALVPPVFVDRIPSDLRQRSIREKKELFFKMILPMALIVNLEIRDIRQRIKATGCRGEVFRCSQHWLRELGDNFRVKTVDELLIKVDEIPPSLMLAQAVEESGWGGSRFSKEGNALFGQRTWDPQDSGMIPYERESGASYRVRAFNDISSSAQAKFQGSISNHHCCALLNSSGYGSSIVCDIKVLNGPFGIVGERGDPGSERSGGESSGGFTMVSSGH